VEQFYEIRVFTRNIQKVAFISGIVIGSALLFFWSRSVGLGFLAGIAISILNFKLMSVDVFEIIGKIPQKAKSSAISRYILRFAIMFGFLALVATRTNYNLFAAFIGLFFVQYVLICERVLRGMNITGKKTLKVKK